MTRQFRLSFSREQRTAFIAETSNRNNQRKRRVLAQSGTSKKAPALAERLGPGGAKETGRFETTATPPVAQVLIRRHELHHYGIDSMRARFIPTFLSVIWCDGTKAFLPQIKNVAMWSLIKFWAALSGIFAASPVAKWMAGEALQDRAFVRPIAALFLTFGLAWMQLIVLDIDWNRLRFKRWLHKVHNFCTRYRKAEED